jgi:hypothetical protein
LTLSKAATTAKKKAQQESSGECMQGSFSRPVRKPVERGVRLQSRFDGVG